MTESLRSKGIAILQSLGLSEAAAAEIADLPVDKIGLLTGALMGLQAGADSGGSKADPLLPIPYEGEPLEGWIAESDRDRLHVIRATGTGVFYHNPAPDAPAFVQIADIMEPGTEFGLLESMKVFTPLALGGTKKMRLVRFMANNNQLVHMGNDLILVVPEED